MAQKKQFTIDDLIPGGATYYQNSVPETRHLVWWGDKCVQLDVDCCYIINKESGAKEKKILTLQKVNDILKAVGKKPVSSLLHCSFPYSDRSYVFVERPDSEIHVIDISNACVVWSSLLGSNVSGRDFNNKSMSLAYVKDHNLYVKDADGAEHAVSTDGSLDLVYGESVHRDEFGITKGTFWSPSGQLLAFYRMDQSMVTSYPQVNISPVGGESRCAELVPDKYPMAGETSHKVSVGIYNMSTKSIVYLQTGDPTDRYFTNISWNPDNKRIYVIELNRDQTHGELVEYSAETGAKLRVLFTEDNDKYFEPNTPIQFLPWDSDYFVYQTRRDGYNHIYLYRCSDGKLVRQLTKGKFEVFNIIGFNKADKSVIYTSNEASPIQQNIYKVGMNGRSHLLGYSAGWHRAIASSDGKYIVDNYSAPAVPRQIDVINTTSGKASNIFVAQDKWKDYDMPKTQVGTIKAADGVTDLYYSLVLPTDFDQNKKYPAIVYVYGGPHAHLIDASYGYGSRGWDIWMAQKGYVMFSLDNRGSEHRGLAFEQATFRNLGVEEMKDQLKGVEYLKSLSYVDSTRLGIHGWSFGGFMTTSLMTTYPDVFKCGVAGGPVIDWKYYEVMYGERYMDTPQSNPDGYANASLLGKAGNLKNRLLIIYGGNDPTCVPQHTLSFIRACIDAGTYPDLFTYPGDGHNMIGTDRVHLHNVITRYFEDHLK